MSSKSDTSGPAKLIVPAMMGVAFGIAIEKGRVFEPAFIVAQMRFERELMLKMFLSAVGSSCAALTAISILQPRKLALARTAFLVQRGHLVVAAGTFILGCGMTVAGACPGTVLAQLGAGVPTAPLVYLGGLLGAEAYALTEHLFRPLWSVANPQRGSESAERALGVSYASVAGPMSLVLGAAVLGLESVFPWRTEHALAAASDGFPALSSAAWPPYVSGAIIGLLQVPAVLFVEDTIGSASSYATIVSAAAGAVSRKARDANAHLARVASGFSNWWQVAYAFGAIAGAFASSRASGTYGTAQGFTPLRSLLGGFMIVFGSRIAAGCTSGHGISGMGLLMLVSVTAVPAMFAGGILTALLPGM